MLSQALNSQMWSTSTPLTSMRAHLRANCRGPVRKPDCTSSAGNLKPVQSWLQRYLQRLLDLWYSAASMRLAVHSSLRYRKCVGKVVIRLYYCFYQYFNVATCLLINTLKYLYQLFSFVSYYKDICWIRLENVLIGVVETEWCELSSTAPLRMVAMKELPFWTQFYKLL